MHGLLWVITRSLGFVLGFSNGKALEGFKPNDKI